MKNLKKILSTVIFITVISVAINAQTFVAGGIFVNSTWTLANSPYIVTDTVVIFPGITLTIQPGVVVKFNSNMQIEVRQASIIAKGTNADSIVFTSNSPTPSAGIYSGIYFNGGTMTSKFNYCNFLYANMGINSTQSDTLMVSHSFFKYNLNGIKFIGSTLNEVALIDNSTFITNSYGAIIKTLHSSKISFFKQLMMQQPVGRNL